MRRVACLDEDTVLGFVDGQLDPDQRSTAESHLASCASCSDLVAATAGADPSRLSIGDDPSGELTASGPGLARGAAVGRYMILDAVGRGGMGEVYAAYDPQLDRKVALKLLHEQAGRGPSARAARARLLREAKTIARLSHPNVVVVHDAGEIDGRVFIAMEFIDGQTLGAWLTAAPRGWREIRDVFLAAGEGLAAAHEAGFVHRDFKPQNVMVGRDGAIRVTDFGLASGGGPVAAGDGGGDSDGAREGDIAPLVPAPDQPIDAPALTRTGVMIGTPLYMAPEQFAARAADARSDQFSFCVALYESLYGERPFPSDSFSMLAEAVLAGRVREPAQRTRAPAFIRRLLLRGLRPSPDDRHPSVRALLEALRHDPAQRRRRLVAGAAIALLAVVGAVATERIATRGQRSCRAASDRLADIWPLAAAAGGGTDRREAVHRAFLATATSYAPETWARVSGLLDDYARRWSGAYTDTCEATHVRGEQSEDVLDLRMSCLEQPRAALRALTDVLGRADGAVVMQAVNGAQALPPLDRCADVAALKAAVPPPADASTRARVDAVRAKLADVKALIDTGQLSTARVEIAPLVTAARSLAYDPLLAEVLAAQAWLAERMSHPADAEKIEEEAFALALASRRDDVALESAALLSGITGYGLAHYDDADRWDRFGQALLKRLGTGHARAEAWLAQDRSLTRIARGDLQGALVDLRAALAIKERALGPDHPDVGTSLASIGTLLTDMDDYQGALEADNRHLELWRRAYGAENPLLAHPLGNRGEALALLGRYAEAEKDLREAIARWPSIVGVDHPNIAYPLTALGKSLLAVGRAREAIPVLERAVRIRERNEPKRDMIAESQFALARARWEAGVDRDGSRTLALAARDAYRALPGETKHAAEIDAWLTARGPSGAPPRH